MTSYYTECKLNPHFGKCIQSESPSLVFSKSDDDTWCMEVVISWRRKKHEFVDGKELMEMRGDGKQVKTVYAFQGDKLVQTQWVEEKVFKVERSIKEDIMTCNFKCANVHGIRIYSRHTRPERLESVDNQ